MATQYQASLAELATAVGGTIDIAGAASADPDLVAPTVSDVVQSTDDVRAGSMFCCIEGANFDGHDLADEAVASGAVALLAQRPLDAGVPTIIVDHSRKAMAQAAAALFDHPSGKLSVIGITGTNGKTTVSHLVAAILSQAKRRHAVLGTLSGARTTPAAPDLQRFLAEAVDDGCDSVAMEVSSHALMQDRVTGTNFSVGVFTNLGRDHLDYHGTQEEYFEAKARLFTPALSAHGVVNVDDPFGVRLLERASIPMTPFSFNDISDLSMTAAGSSFMWRDRQLQVPFPGRFNVANALAAATAAAQVGIELDDIVDGLASTPPVQGRFHRVDAGQDFAAIVDFAHTPDALDQALRAARELTAGQVIVVFGCGGDRDRDKRPEMGAVATALADVVVVTSDNPRSEPPEAIIDEILAGIPVSGAAVREPDRQMAIAVALSRAQSGDLVLVAGKGHETTQTVGDTVLSFDDVAVVDTELRRMLGLRSGDVEPGRTSIE